MEEKKIIVTINEDKIELESNNPSLKKLVDAIIKQKEDYDFNEIIVEIDDENFDKESFKDILLKSIQEFKKNLILLQEQKDVTDKKIIQLESNTEK